MRKRKTHEEYVEELKEVNTNIIPLEKYIDCKTPIFHKCLIDNNEWKISPLNTLHGEGCPICGHQKTISKQRKSHEQYVQELSVINPNIEVLEPYINYSTKIFHRCRIDDYIWKVSPTSILKNGCPKCSSVAKVTHEDYCKRLKIINPNIKPIEHYVNMKTNILHKCKIDGYEWNLKPLNAIKGRGCPVCSNKIIIEGYNDFQSTHPNIAKDWNWELNKIKPTEIASGSNKDVWWTCPICNHNYKAKISNRVYNDLQCPQCCIVHKKSIRELKVYYYIKKYFDDAISGYKNDNITELDIFIPSLNIGVEYDGERWHKDINRDIKKDNICKDNGIKLIRIREKGCPNYISECTKIIMSSYKQNEIENSISYVLKILGVKNAEVNFKKDHNDIYNLVYERKKENSLAILYPNLIEDWNYERNGNLTPYNVSCGSERKVWWKCKNCEYEWYTSVYVRTKYNTRCPNCRKK